MQRAQAGRYHRIEMNRGLPARYVVRYFDHIGENWVVKPEVRRLCHFRRANLCGPSLPFNRSTDRFDVIFLRNVMLYFDQPTRRALLAGHLWLPTASSFSAPASNPPTSLSGLPSWPADPLPPPPPAQLTWHCRRSSQ